MPNEQPSESPAVRWHSEVASAFTERGYAANVRFRERRALWSALIGRYGRANGRALDVGCGAGELSVLLAANHREVLAIDGSRTMLDFAAQRCAELGLCNVKTVHRDLEDLGKERFGQFDLIIASSVLEYLTDLESVLASLRSMCEVDATLIFSVPNSDSLYRKLEPVLFRTVGWPSYYAFVRHRKNKDEISDLLPRHGFRLVELRYASHTPVLSRLLGPLGASRWAENLLVVVAQAAPRAEHRSLAGHECSTRQATEG